MTTEEEIVCIKKIIDNEKWLLSEKIGYDCGEEDSRLLTRVCEIVLKEGERMRLSKQEEYLNGNRL